MGVVLVDVEWFKECVDVLIELFFCVDNCGFCFKCCIFVCMVCRFVLSLMVLLLLIIKMGIFGNW